MLAVLSLCAASAHAEDPPVADKIDAAPSIPPSSVSPLPQVTVQGHRASELSEQRSASAAIGIVSSKDIEKYGDGTVSALLAQQPGITVTGIPGRRGGEIQIRGLGAVQILVNGDPVPSGFTVDMLSLSLIERIEIFRVAVAEHSAQAYAGTVNFVLKAKRANDKNQMGLTAVVPDEAHLQPRVQATLGGTVAGASISMGLSGERYTEFDSRYVNRTVTRTPEGVITFDQADDAGTLTHGHELRLTPAVRWSNPFGSTLKADALVMRAGEARDTTYRIQQNVGDAPYAQDLGTYDSTFGVDRLNIKGTHSFGDGLATQVEASLTLNSARWDKQESHIESEGGHDYGNSVHAVNHGLTAKLKLTHSVGDADNGSMGLDLDDNHRDEVWTQSQDGQPYGFGDGSRPSSSARTVAAFAQWDARRKAYSYYVGVRGESLLLRSHSDTQATAHRFDLLSPIAQFALHMGGDDHNQLRVGLSRGYRAPRVTDLLDRTVVSTNNSPFSPDVSGNPNVGPERVWNLDISLEHYIGDDTSLSAGIYAKRIDGTLLTQVVQQEDSRWVNQISNAGRTIVAGLSLDAKGHLDKLIAGAPALEIQASGTYNWSRIDAIPGANNRVFGQIPATLALSADYRQGTWTFGTRWSWNIAYRVRTSATMVNDYGATTLADAYLRWAPRPGTRVKLSVANLLRRDKRQALATDLGVDGEQLTNQLAKTWSTWTLSLTQDF